MSDAGLREIFPCEQAPRLTSMARTKNRNTRIRRARERRGHEAMKNSNSPIALKPLVAAVRKAASESNPLKVMQWGLGALAAIPGAALAGPSGESVVAGAVSVQRPDANRTQINQVSQNAIVNWQSFSVAGNEHVLIEQPNASAAILNRVIGSQQSRILGQIEANGRVFLVNPQGVYVAPGASIDVGSLTLSALDIDNDDFMAGRYFFSKVADSADATIENAGTISADDGGYVVLAGDYVDNSGVISARLGSVVLAAGDEITMELDDTGLVGFAIDEHTVAELAGVNNAGEIIADGGRIVMTAKVANDLVATAVNNDGLVRAKSIVEHDGEVFLQGLGGDVSHSGRIDVSGSSGMGGGRAIIYSDEDVIAEGSSEILATGHGQADGGRVRLVADGRLEVRADAEIDARGGGQGDSEGGFVELSGHGGLSIKGDVAVGAGGQLLIDPAVLRIQNNSSGPFSSEGGGGPCSSGASFACVGRGFIEGQLNANTDVLLIADTEITSSGGPFTINATSGGGDLSMKIGMVSYGGFACSSLGVCTSGSGSGSGSSAFSPDPTGNINLGNIGINILGSFHASAGTSAGNVNLGAVRAHDNVTINAGSNAGNINVNNIVVIGSGGEGSADAQAQLFAGAGNINVAGAVTITASSQASYSASAGGNITQGGKISAISTSGGLAQITLDATGNISTGAMDAFGFSASIDLIANNATVNGAVNVGGSSFAAVDVFVNNNFTLNGPGVNISEAGGGSAQFRARAPGAGIATINAPINVVAGPGGVADVYLGSEGFFNQVIVNRRVRARGGSDAYVNAVARNLVRTQGTGVLDAHGVQVITAGLAPTVDIVSQAEEIYVGIFFGGAANVTVDNSAFSGPSEIHFGGGTNVMRSATFLSTGNLTFQDNFQADRLLVGVTNGSVSFNGAVNITGANPFLPTAPDIELFQIMSARGLTPPSHGPNVQILGANGINMSSPFVLGGPDPFIKLFSSVGFNTSGLTTNASNVLAVFNPVNLASPIIFRNMPASPVPGALSLFNFPNVQSLPNTSGTTVVIGEKGPAAPFLSGPIAIGPSEPIDLGDRNLFIISRGQVSGDDLISTNGVFEVIGLAATNIFETPITNDFNESETTDDGDDDDEELGFGEGDDSGEGDGEISEESNSDSMECAA